MVRRSILRMAVVATIVVATVSVHAQILLEEQFTTDPLATPARFDAGSDPITWKDTNQFMLYQGSGSMVSTDPVKVDTAQTNLFSYDFYFLASGTYTSASMYAFTQDAAEPGYYVKAYMASSGNDSRWLEDPRLNVYSAETGWTQNMTSGVWYTIEMELLNDADSDDSVIWVRVKEQSTGTVIGTFKAHDAGNDRLKSHTGLIVEASGKDATKPTRVDNVLVEGVTPQQVQLFSDFFQDDPFAAPQRWTRDNDKPEWKSTNFFVIFNPQKTETAMHTVEQFIIDPAKSNLISFNYAHLDMGLTWLRTYAFRQGDNDGYLITAYKASETESAWIIDDRFDTIYEESMFPLLQSNWYRLEMQMASNPIDGSVVSVEIYDTATETFMGKIVAADTDTNRLTTHTGLTIAGRPNNNTIRIDNVQVWGNAITPPATCEEVWQQGFGLDADLNQDCHVDLVDYGLFTQDWLVCNDPQGCP